MDDEDDYSRPENDHDEPMDGVTRLTPAQLARFRDEWVPRFMWYALAKDNGA